MGTGAPTGLHRGGPAPPGAAPPGTPPRGGPPSGTPGPAAGALPRLTATEALAALGSSRRGLPAAEARARLAADGPNLLPPPPRRPWTRELAAQFANMFAVMLVVAAGFTVAAWALSHPRDIATLELAVGIVGVVLLNAAIGFVQEHAAERTAETLQAMVPHTARVLRDGEVTALPVEAVVRGDLVALDAGDAVPADCRVVEAHDLTVEMAAITGESDPVRRMADPVATAAPAEARNCVLMGTSVTSGSARAVVFATGSATEFGRLYRLAASVPPEPSPLQRQVASMARKVALVAAGAGVVLFASRVLTGQPVAESFVFALGVMVALVPEGLPATLSVSLAIGVRRMARHQALVKRLAAVEALGSTTVICTDKTGTLTQAEMTVQQVWESGRLHAVQGVGYRPVGTVEDAPAAAGVLRTGARCSDARVVAGSRADEWRVIGDPTEGAIVVAAIKAGVDLADDGRLAPRVGTFPFDTDRRLMTTLHQVDGAVVACVKGSPEAVLHRCRAARWDGTDRPLDPALERAASDADDSLAAQGLRVLAVAERRLPPGRLRQEDAEQDLTLLGLVAMADPPRPEVTAAVADCHRAGIRIVMVTGDYGLTAEAIARRVGIVGPGPVRVVSGDALDTLDDPGLQALVADASPLLFARARPEHKLRIVQAFEEHGEVVAVTGDGANDAPALRRAGIGVAMGRSGTDVARAAAVMVLLDDSFAAISRAVELGRAVYQNIRRFLVYVFVSNLAELAPIVAATFVGFPLVPLSALQVLTVDLGSDVLPALALGAEPPEPGVMDRPPRPTGARLFDAAVVRRVLFLGAIESLGVVVAFFWRIHTAHLPFDAFTTSSPVYREARATAQAAIVVGQFFASLAVRTDRASALRAGLLRNRALVAAGLVGIGLMCAISYVPVLQRVFGTAALRLSDWLLVAAFGVLLLVADEARKAWHRRTARSRAGREEPCAS